MQSNQDQNHWDNIGEAYTSFWKSKAKQEMNKEEMLFIQQYLRKTKSQYILDIGVGPGRIIGNYLANPSVKEIYGVDWAKSMVDYCKKKFKNEQRLKNILTCDISQEQVPFKKDFDFVSAIRVLKYNKNWQKIVGKIINILKKDGIFVFTIPNKNAFLRFTTPETAIYSTTKKEVEDLIKTQKGEILRITGFGKLPDVFYDISNNRFYVEIILFSEWLLKKLFGDIFLGKSFFVAIRKK